MSLPLGRQGSRLPTDEDFAFLLEDRAFVDYFNIFITLPVFGQQIFYNFIERGFVYDPPIKKKRNYVDRRCVIAFLIEERYPLFEKTSLFLEYLLCCRLRDVEVDFESKTFKEESEKRAHFSRNVLGHVVGMQMFREFIRGTAGENVFKCWIEIARWKLSEETPSQKTELAHNIKATYLAEGSQCDLRTKGKRLVFEGKIDFELIPEREIQDEILKATSEMDILYMVETSDAFDNLQRILLSILRRYWVPRYFIHLYHTVSSETLSFLKKETPFDIGTLAQQRKLRCQIMFPRIYSASRSSPGSPTTPVFLSCDADRLPEPAYSVTSSDVHAQTPDVEIPSNTSDRNIEPLELLSLWSGQGYSRQRSIATKGNLSGSKNDEFDDAYGLKELEIWEKAESSRFLGGSPILYTIPLFVNSYVKGRKRVDFDNTILDKNNKMAASFASDMLAGYPFRQYLQERQLKQDSRMLDFWSDVRQYMDADDGYLDPYGIPMKRKLARTLTDKYLTLNNDLEYDIFSEQLKMTLYQGLNSRDDVILMSYAQNIISHALKESWQQYSRQERTSFRMKVCGSRIFDRNVIEIQPRSASARGQSDPLFYVNSNTPSPTGLTCNDMETTPGQSTSFQETVSPFSRMTSALGALTLTPEQSLKALEFAVLCAEYGRSGVSPQVSPRLEDLIDVLYSDYGSLHIKREPAKRHEFLHNLLNKPKIDIETIKVSRRVLLATPEVSAMERGQFRSRLQRLVLRRRGILIERPTRPRNLVEVMQSPIHFEFFKRFMMDNKTVHPLLFWKYVEDLKEAQFARHRNHIISVIYRKFFSKAAKQGYLLDCSDDIIRQIPTMERIPASVLICAQASVFRSLEKKWFPRYMQTYQVDADYPPPEQTAESPLAKSPTFADLTEKLVINKEAMGNKRKTQKKRKTWHLWRGFLHLITDFMDAMEDEYEFKLLELYMRNEQEKDSKRKRVADKSLLTSSTIAAYQTRVVLRNRLVIINKLVADLNFWNEIQKFKKHIDEISTRENITKVDMDFLQLKAKAIVDCYLVSEVLPRVQVNIPSDLATSIAVSLTHSGPTRGLFHDAMILIFPIIYFFWKRFRDEWLKGHDPKDFYFRLKEKLTVPWVSCTPHKDLSGPDYLHVRESQCQMMAVNLHEDEPFRINFTVMGGIRYMFSNRMATKPATMPANTVGHSARRHHNSRRSQRNSVNRIHRLQAEDATHGEHRYSRHDMKKKSKIILEDEESVRNLDQGDLDVKSERSLEIQKPEEQLGSSATALPARRRRQPAATNQCKAFRISQLVEELNSESNRPIAQRLRTLDQVVRAALNTQNRSQFTDDAISSLTSLLN
eukprot:XP_011413410.2 PREDICTED: regulator of G-protein signaling protein-like [Crassostrea gigas]